MKKILLVTGKEFITVQNDGGRKCTYRNYELLEKVYGKENVYAYIFTNEYGDANGSDANIARIHANRFVLKKVLNLLTGRLFCSITQERNLVKYIQQSQFDIVFFERSLFGALIRKVKKMGVEVQVFMENIEHDYAKNKVINQSFLYYLPYLAFKYNEKQSLKYCDKIMCLTKRDADRLKEMYGKICDVIIPMTFKDKCKNWSVSIPKVLKKEIMFIGSLCPPNYNGIKWFVQEVMPRLPEFHLYIVGKGFEAKRDELEKGNITVIGTVDELDEYYKTDRAIVMPIPYGDGIKVKTAEAMMYGKVIFATHEALEGYDVDEITDITECNHADEFVKAIQDFYSKRASSFSEAVRCCFLEKYENSTAVQLYNTRIYEAENN